MRVGIDYDNHHVFIELGEKGGIKVTGSMDTKAARAIAEQLTSSADLLDTVEVDKYLDNLGENDVDNNG